MNKAEHKTARLAALQAGAQRYQGPPCQHGHSGERYTISMSCVTCQRDAKRAQRERERAMRPAS